VTVAPARRIGPLSVLSATATAVGLVTAVLGLVFLLLPQLKPAPPAPPPAHTAARLRTVAFEEGVTFGEYLARTDQHAGGLNAVVLRRRGVLVTFRFDIFGYKGQRLPLRWHQLDARSGRSIGEQDAVTITATADRHEGDWSAWIATPRAAGPYAVVVNLMSPDGRVPLATLRTPRFAGLTPGP
jgi:hypothetical protein